MAAKPRKTAKAKNKPHKPTQVSVWLLLDGNKVIEASHDKSLLAEAVGTERVVKVTLGVN